MDNPVRSDVLLVAIKNLDSDYVSNLIKTKQVPKVALSVAISTGSEDMVRLILSSVPSSSGYFTAGTMISSEGKISYQNPMQQAVMLGDPSIINSLLDYNFAITEMNLDYLIDIDDLELFIEILKLIKNNTIITNFNFAKNLLGPILYQHAYNYNKMVFIQVLKQLNFINNNYQTDPLIFCDVDANGNITDSVENEITPEDRVVAMRENANNFCFDLLFLYNQWRATGKLQNPITRGPLPVAIVNRIMAYAEANRVKFTFVSKDGVEILTIDNDSDLGQLLLLFNEANKNRKINKKYQTPENLDKFDLIFIIPNDAMVNNKSIYDFDLTTLLKDLNLISCSGNALCTELVQLQVVDVSNNIIFDAKVYPSLYHYAQAKRIEWLLDFIPDIYQVQQPRPLDLVDDENFDDLLLTINDHQTDITAYGLAKDLTRDVNGLVPKISAEQARSLIKLINEIEYEDSADYLNYIKNLIYSRVVDKFNLTNNGLERDYLRNRYQLPDWRVLNVKY